jgi:uncharacterized FlaG/YvyC family protein
MAEDIATSGLYAVLNSADLPAYQTATPVVRPAAPVSDERAQTSASVASEATAAAANVTAARPATNSANSAPAAASAAEIQAAVSRANANLASYNRVVAYQVDAASGLTIATVRNAQTGAVVQEIPGAGLLALARMLADWSPGKHVMVDLIA